MVSIWNGSKTMSNIPMRAHLITGCSQKSGLTAWESCSCFVLEGAAERNACTAARMYAQGSISRILSNTYRYGGSVMILSFVRRIEVVYRMNGTHADIPSSSSVPVSPVGRTPKYGSNRSLPTIRDMDAEQGSLGSQGSVDLPVDSGQARLLELGKSFHSRHGLFSRLGDRRSAIEC